MTQYVGTARAISLPDPVSIREQLFLLAHDEDRHLEPWIDLRALGIGLAGAALIDLMTGPWRHPPAPDPIPPGDQVYPPRSRDPGTEHVRQCLTGVLPAVLQEIAPRLYDRTSTALTARGYIVTDRRWGRDRFHLADTAPVVRIRGKIRNRIASPRPPFSPDTEALCALVWALNMPHCLIFRLSRTQLNALLSDVTAHLPAWASSADPLTSIPEVAEAVRAAVDHLALAPF